MRCGLWDVILGDFSPLLFLPLLLFALVFPTLGVPGVPTVPGVELHVHHTYHTNHSGCF